MKIPRTEDFDPNAAPGLGSPMDALPTIVRPVPTSARPPTPPALEAKTDVEDAVSSSSIVSEPVSESKNERLKEGKKVRLITFLQTHLQAKADGVASFRYPQSVVDLLEDVVNDVWQRHRKKVTKTSVIVAAIASLVWDFEENGETSTLYRALVKEED
jgi:hypothetical protein